MLTNIIKYIIKYTDTISLALEKIEQNKGGFILVVDENAKVVGLATDGDVRRSLLDGSSLSDPVSKCMNINFLSADVSTPREQLLKKLDSNIRFIPILDIDQKLHSIVTRNHLPLKKEEEVYIRSRAPVRVSFGGGGSDVTRYFSNTTGAVLNATISVYSHATMRLRNDSRIIINSYDLNCSLEASDLANLLSRETPLGLIQALLQVVKPSYGFNLDIHSDFPVGSGLGGSATISAAVLGCFNELRIDKWNEHELSEIAFQAERLHLGIAGGWQDQYAAVFGGFNFIEFNGDQNIIYPIKLRTESLLELEESLVLCDTGIEHNSGDIHLDQQKSLNDKVTRNNIKRNVDLCYQIRHQLLRNNFDDFGQLLDKVWSLKRSYSKMISNSYIDEIYAGALENGALGGKLLGAGGGGFLIFYVPAIKKHKLLKFLRKRKLRIQPFRFEEQGLTTWSNRITDRK